MTYRDTEVTYGLPVSITEELQADVDAIRLALAVSIDEELERLFRDGQKDES